MNVEADNIVSPYELDIRERMFVRLANRWRSESTESKDKDRQEEEKDEELTGNNISEKEEGERGEHPSRSSKTVQK